MTSVIGHLAQVFDLNARIITSLARNSVLFICMEKSVISCNNELWGMLLLTGADNPLRLRLTFRGQL